MIFVVEPVRSRPSGALPNSCLPVAVFTAYAPWACTCGAAVAVRAVAADGAVAAWAGAVARTPAPRTAPAATATAALLRTRATWPMVMVPPSVSGQLTRGQFIRSGARRAITEIT